MYLTVMLSKNQVICTVDTNFSQCFFFLNLSAYMLVPDSNPYVVNFVLELYWNLISCFSFAVDMRTFDYKFQVPISFV